MQTSWYGVFDMDPDDTIQVRAGDLQEFLRQQMMGVTNPGLTVTTPEERSDAQPPARGDDEVFCAIRWSRADIVDAIENACGIRLDRDGDDSTEVEGVIDRVIDAVQNGLEDRSTEFGWEVIDTLMPQDALDRAVEISDRSAERDLTSEKRESSPSYRSAVIDALGKAGWKVRGNDSGDLFSLTYRSPQSDREFAVVFNMRGRDADTPSAWIQAALEATTDDSVLWSGGTDRDNMNLVYHDINRFKDGMRRELPEVVKQAVVSVEPQGYDDNHVRDWFMRNYPEDELGAQIAPDLTFDDALRAVARGGDFYVALGVGDSLVRNLVFDELAARYDVPYDDIYDAWLNERPVDVPLAPSAERAQDGVSLSEEAALSRQASEQLSSDGRGPDSPVRDGSVRG